VRHTRRFAIRSLTILALPLALLAAGCSSDDSSDTTVAVAETTVVAETAAADTAVTDTVAPDSSVADDTGAATVAADSTVTSAGDSTAAATPQAQVKTASPGKLVVCSDIPYAPFEYYANGADGDVTGIDIDILNGIAAKIGLTPEYVKTPFDGIFAALAAGSCDMIASSVSITAERKQANDFSDGYFTIQQSILVRSADAALNDLPALKGKTVGGQSGTTGSAFATAGAAANGYTVKDFQQADDLVTALKAGQVDAVIQDSPINGYAATKSGGALVVSKVFEGEGEEYGFVMPKNNPGLTAALNAGLKELRADGTYKTILTKYLGAAAAVS
jgi:polar amino acid transport system substrate-binding protein